MGRESNAGISSGQTTGGSKGTYDAKHKPSKFPFRILRLDNDSGLFLEAELESHWVRPDEEDPTSRKPLLN